MRALFALFVRSMREDARARLPPILRATLVLVILLILWANERDFTRRTAPGREFLGMVLFANVGLIAITTIGIFSSAITEEKEDQTLTLLRMTKLSPLAILLGKSTSRLFLALTMIAAQIPFTLLSVALGGVSREQVLGGYGVLAANTFLLCNLALLCSVLCRTTIRAGISTGVIASLIFGLLPILCVSMGLKGMNPATLSLATPVEKFCTLVLEANPLYVIRLLLFEISAVAPVSTLVSLNLIAGILCFLLSWMFFDLFCAKSTGNEMTGKGRRVPRRGVWQIRSRPSAKRALAWKDFYFLSGGLRGLFRRFVLCGLIAAGALLYARWRQAELELVMSGTTFSYYRQNNMWEVAGNVMSTFAVALFALETLLIASRIFGEERRDLTLGSLVTLPRTTGWLISQKLLGCFPAVIPSLILWEIGLWVGFRGSGSPSAWLMLSELDSPEFCYLLTQALLLIALIAFLSLRIRRGALPSSIAIVITINGLTVVAIRVSQIDAQNIHFLMTAVCAPAVPLLILKTYRAIPRAGAAE